MLGYDLAQLLGFDAHFEISRELVPFTGFKPNWNIQNLIIEAPQLISFSMINDVALPILGVIPIWNIARNGGFIPIANQTGNTTFYDVLPSNNHLDRISIRISSDFSEKMTFIVKKASFHLHFKKKLLI